MARFDGPGVDWDDMVGGYVAAAVLVGYVLLCGEKASWRGAPDSGDGGDMVFGVQR
jgi:hypothetical protein